MKRSRARGMEIRRYILANIEKNPAMIAAQTAENFSITRQAVSKHLARLRQEGVIDVSGNTRGSKYSLRSLWEWQREYPIQPGLAEDQVWTRDVAPVLGKLPENVLDIWAYCFTEMFNNALDHSQGSLILLQIVKTAANTQMVIADNGVGIFKKIQSAMNLIDERHAIFELCKGKLTTDPSQHTGQGIFFTSRLVDSFDLFGGGVSMSHVLGKEEDWIFEHSGAGQNGTQVFLKVDDHTSRTPKEIFDSYSSAEDEDYGFIKTVVPVKLAQYGNEKLISRSQAKRVLARVEKFRKVILDFEGVPLIGQAFADEVFRVFPGSHPEVQMMVLHANTAVKRMIQGAKSDITRPQQAELPLL